MRRGNLLYFLLGILVVAVGLLGYAYMTDNSHEIQLETPDKEFNLDISEKGIKGTLED